MLIESMMKAQLHSYCDRDPKNGGRPTALTGPLPHAPRIGPHTALPWSHKDPKDTFCAARCKDDDGAKDQPAGPRQPRPITCARQRKPHACGRDRDGSGARSNAPEAKSEPNNQHIIGKSSSKCAK